MKFLKLFENHGYYEEIYYYELVKKYESETMPFKKEEIEKIENLLYNRLPLFKFSTDAHNRMYIMSSKPTFITKTYDEWFYVTIILSKSHYYKCDQFEGLLKCLNDVL